MKGNNSTLNKLLFDSALSGNNEAVVELLFDGAEVNSRHTLGATPLFVAVTYNHVNTVKLLSYVGADIESPIDKGTTPLFKSAHSCHSNITRILLKSGANTETTVDGYSPLYAAISSGCVEDVKILLEAGALIHSDSVVNTPILIANQERDSSEFHKEIYKIIRDHYQRELAELPLNEVDNSGDFRVVVVRYNEDLSWLNKEFKNEKILIYNKGEDDLFLKDLPVNSEIIKIPNTGWFGGTILHHLIHHYDRLYDRTLFLQGDPYDQHLLLPLIRYKKEDPFVCKNIVGRCVESSLLERSKNITNIDKLDWEASRYGGGKFQLFENYSMIDFAHQYVDGEIIPEKPLSMVWGAQFAVKKDKVYTHKKEFYQRLLEMFDEIYPMADFYLEKLWDLVFQGATDTTKIDKQLFDAVLEGDKQAVIDLLNKGVNINSRHDIGATPVYAAANKNKPEILELLIKEKADIEIPADNGGTPLFSAALNCNAKATKILIESGADIEKNVDGYTPLAAAIYSKCKDVVVQLLDAGADLLSDVVLSETDIDSYRDVKIPFQLSSFFYNREDKDSRIDEIHSIVLDYYYNTVADKIREVDQKTMNDKRSFEVVVVRYKEDLSWVSKEFPHDKVTVYNKGPDDIEELPGNINVINTENVGYLGGTYLKHIVDNYNNLADRTLFIQGDPYDVNTFFPLIRFKGDLESKCKNIIGKCVNTTLAKEWEFLKNLDWDNIPRYKDFVPRNASMLDFHYKYIGNQSLDEAMYVTYGAVFAADKEVILRHEVEHYSVMLPGFNDTKTMLDHFMEREWDWLFDPIKACFGL
ncbi:MAG: DUF3431 domain-containing protein [Rickettsiales bacterium]|nr:DUF3431 domain-containing protein [Rickettsiales bacterium]